jgi:hypothetical protein
MVPVCNHSVRDGALCYGRQVRTGVRLAPIDPWAVDDRAVVDLGRDFMRRLLLVLSAALIVAAITASSVLAVQGAVQPDETGPGNPPCSFVKIDPVRSGTYEIEGGWITIHKVSTSMGPAFWFETNTDMDALTVKGGPTYALYLDPSGGESNLYHSPLNPKNKNNQWYGLSHLCIDSKKVDEG